MTTTKDNERQTLIEAMAEIDNGQKWWTLKEIRRLLKDLGWIGKHDDQMRSKDIVPMLALALANERLEARYNDAIGENEFRVNNGNI